MTHETSRLAKKKLLVMHVVTLDIEGDGRTKNSLIQHTCLCFEVPSPAARQ